MIAMPGRVIAGEVTVPSITVRLAISFEQQPSFLKFNVRCPTSALPQSRFNTMC
jgi:hypothetical protein